jgi:ACS family hexuronate transporter-like MFS transporter
MVAPAVFSVEIRLRTEHTGSVKRPLRHLRWYIGGLLFLSTVVNYIDRQTLSVLGPILKKEHGWSNTDFMWIIVAFRCAYSIGQAVSGRWLDRVGTRDGLSLAVLWYSLVAMATSFATGLRSFCGFRFLLGAGEAANWPGATKAVSEWFPRRESGWAVALFDSGSSIGGALAPLIVFGSLSLFDGDWRPVFAVTGTLGLLWLVAWRAFYRPPETHPRLSAEERAMILADRESGAATASGERLPYRTLLRLPQTWGFVIGKSLTDPVWFFVTDWFPIFLVARGFALQESLVGLWVPFLAADAGNFFGGGFSSFLIRRGVSVGRARKVIAVVGGLGMTLMVPAMFASSLLPIVVCFAISTFAYAAFSTVLLNLPADLYPSHSVATVSGLGGMGAGIGTIAATLLIGFVSDRVSFQPILLGAGTIALVAMAAVLLLVRNNTATERGVVRRI